MFYCGHFKNCYFQPYTPQLLIPSANSVSNEDKCKRMEDKHLRLLGNSLYDKRSSLSDVTLECNGGEIQAHRIVLSASCNYFDAMFRFNLKESSTGTVQLKEIDVEVMEIIVKFLYTGSIGEVEAEDDVSLLKKLYAVADFMQITELTQSMSDTLICKIDLDNYLELWDLASKLGNSQLVDGILEKLNENCIDFVDGDRYVGLNLDQMSILLRNFKGQCATDKLVRMVLQWAEKDFDRRYKDTEELVKLLDLNGLTNVYLYELINDDRIMQLPQIVAGLFKISAERLQKFDSGSSGGVHQTMTYVDGKCLLDGRPYSGAWPLY